MRSTFIIVTTVTVLLMGVTSCAKPLVNAHVNTNVRYLHRAYAASANDIYYAVRDALVREGYGVTREDLANGSMTSSWVPTTSDSHYVDLFNRRNNIVNGGYYQLDVRIIPEGSTTRVEVGSIVKSVVARLESSGIKEKQLLDDLARGLRKVEPTITNLGISE